MLAVTGGTGIYRNVSGQITIESIDDNTSRDTLELTAHLLAAVVRRRVISA